MHLEILSEHKEIIKEFKDNVMSNRALIMNKYNPSQIIHNFTNIPFGFNNETITTAVDFSDIFYLPKSKFKNYHFLSSLTNRFEIFLGIFLKSDFQ